MGALPNPHPLIVHFAIALFIAGAVIDLLGLRPGRDDWRPIGRANLLLGTAAAIFAALSGWYAGNTVEHVAQAHELMENHETLGWVITGLAVVIAAWRVARPALGRVWYAVAVIVVVGMLLLQGYWGGELVFRYGVGVSGQQTSGEEHPHGVHEHHAGSH